MLFQFAFFIYVNSRFRFHQKCVLKFCAKIVYEIGVAHKAWANNSPVLFANFDAAARIVEWSPTWQWYAVRRGDVERPALSLLNTFRWCLHYADSGNTAARTLGTQTRGQAAVKCFVTKCSALKIATFWMTAKWIRVWCKRLSAQKAAPCEKFKEAGIKF